MILYHVIIMLIWAGAERLYGGTRAGEGPYRQIQADGKYMGRDFGGFQIMAAVMAGVLAGLASFTFNYAEGTAYLSSDPAACVNCHIMSEQYDSWRKSGHRAAAVCVDCHLPHNLIGKYAAKAANGYHHSKSFTLQDFHEPIRIKAGNRAILQHNCKRCHAGMTADIQGAGGEEEGGGVDCLKCHRRVGHGV